MSNDDMSLLMVCAERYALGRRTYMPGLICKIIKENIDLLSEKDLKVIINDIKNPSPLAVKPWGDECDKKEWMDLLEVLEKAVIRLR